MKFFLSFALLLCSCAAVHHGEYVYYRGKKCEVRSQSLVNGRLIYTINVPGPGGRHHVESVPPEVLTWKD